MHSFDVRPLVPHGEAAEQAVVGPDAASGVGDASGVPAPASDTVVTTSAPPASPAAGPMRAGAAPLQPRT